MSPSSTVLLGGLSPAANAEGNIAPVDFLSQVYAAGDRAYFDAVAFHPYSFPVLPLNPQPWNAWTQMATASSSLRSVMLANGDGEKKIWVTEYGAPTGGPGASTNNGTLANYSAAVDHVTEALQAQMMAQAVAAEETTTWMGPLFWYSYEDLGTSTGTIENFFGLLRHDGSQKPAYPVLKGLASSTTP